MSQSLNTHPKTKLSAQISNLQSKIPNETSKMHNESSNIQITPSKIQCTPPQTFKYHLELQTKNTSLKTHSPRQK